MEKLQKEQKDYRRFQWNISNLERLKHISVVNMYVKKKSLRSTTQQIKKAAPAHKKVSQQLQVLEKAQMEAQQKLAKLKYTPDAKVQKQRQADMLQCEIQTLRDRKQRVSVPAKFNYVFLSFFSLFLSLSLSKKQPICA